MEQEEQGWAGRKIEEVTYANPLPGMTALLNNLGCSMILSTALLALANLSEVILAPSHVITFKCVSLLYLTINSLRQIYLWVPSTLMKQIQRHWVQNFTPINYLTFLKLSITNLYLESDIIQNFSKEKIIISWWINALETNYNHL